MHKAGFVNIVGKPNAGKSTLLNQLMGEKLAIVTQKAQTTRHRIFGIYNEEDVQIVFSDTPGVLDPKYGLQEKMMDFVKDSLQDADVFLFIVDVTDKDEPNEFLVDKLNKIPVSVLLLLNKMDASNQEALIEKDPFKALADSAISLSSAEKELRDAEDNLNKIRGVIL